MKRRFVAVLLLVLTLSFGWQTTTAFGLTEDEKRKIIEEEKLRTEVRQNQVKKAECEDLCRHMSKAMMPRDMISDCMMNCEKRWGR